MATVTFRRDHTAAEIEATVAHVAEMFGFAPHELGGATLREVFTDAERYGVSVFWGLWTERDLDTVIGRVRVPNDAGRA